MSARNVKAKRATIRTITLTCGFQNTTFREPRGNAVSFSKFSDPGTHEALRKTFAPCNEGDALTRQYRIEDGEPENLNHRDLMIVYARPSRWSSGRWSIVIGRQPMRAIALDMCSEWERRFGIDAKTKLKVFYLRALA